MRSSNSFLNCCESVTVGDSVPYMSMVHAEKYETKVSRGHSGQMKSKRPTKFVVLIKVVE